jgi:hypothetical protein
MGNRILSGLSGNTSVKKLAIYIFEEEQIRFLALRADIFVKKVATYNFEEQIRSLALALPTNRGIERLEMYLCLDLSDETLSLLYRSLSMHPRVEVLSLVCRSVYARPQLFSAILQMFHVNTVVHTINLPAAFRNDEVYRNSVLPRLEMNRTCLEVQRQAVKRADPSIRPQLLGRALHVVRYNPELVFRFLSENVPAFVWSEEEDPMEVDPIILFDG